MNTGPLVYGILCETGGVLIGLFANRLDTILGGEKQMLN